VQEERLGVRGGLGLSGMGVGAPWEVIRTAEGWAALSWLLALAASLALLRVLPCLPWGRRLALATELPAGVEGASAPEHDRRGLGHCGPAATPWRPAGIAHLDGTRVDVGSEGECSEAGEPIGVIRVDGNRIVVRRMHAPNTQACVMSASLFVNRAATSLVVAGGIYGRTRCSP
jgi:membrane-bound serine protease (ClpP class)